MVQPACRRSISPPQVVQINLKQKPLFIISTNLLCLRRHLLRRLLLPRRAPAAMAEVRSDGVDTLLKGRDEDVVRLAAGGLPGRRPELQRGRMRGGVTSRSAAMRSQPAQRHAAAQRESVDHLPPHPTEGKSRYVQR